MSPLELRMVHFAHSATVALGPKQGVFDLNIAKFASGVVIKKGSRYFIATVAHYLEAVPVGEMSVTFAPRSLMLAKDVQEIIKLASRLNLDKEITQSVPVKALRHNCGTDLEDVAIVEIEPESVPSFCWAYNVDEFPRLRHMPKAGEMLLLTGLPRENALAQTPVRPPTNGAPPDRNLVRIAEANYRQTQPIQNPEHWTDASGNRRFFPDFHFALTYPVPNRVAPFGLSGSGVWRANEGETTAGIIQPYPVLVGIENNYNDIRDCVKVTGISRALALIDGPMECARCKERAR